MSASGSLSGICGIFCQFFIGCGCNQFAGFVQFIHLFYRQSGLRHHIAAALRETVVKGLIVADTDHIGDLIPVVVRVKSVAGLRLLRVIQPSVTAGELEAAAVMGKVAFAYIIYIGNPPAD